MGPMVSTFETTQMSGVHHSWGLKSAEGCSLYGYASRKTRHVDVSELATFDPELYTEVGDPTRKRHAPHRPLSC